MSQNNLRVTSAALLTKPTSSTDSAAFFSSLKQPTCCVVQLRHQPQGVVHQVVLDPAKVRGELIRIGDWAGDEAAGWQYLGNVRVILVLGIATRDSDSRAASVKVAPIG